MFPSASLIRVILPVAAALLATVRADLVHSYDASFTGNVMSGSSLVQWKDSGPGRDYGSGTVNIHLNRAAGVTRTPNFSSPGTILSASFMSAGANGSGVKPENEPQSASIGNGLNDATFEFWVRADLEDSERPNWQVIWESGATTNGFAVLLSTNGIFTAELRVIKAWNNAKIVDITVPLTNFESSDFFQIAVTMDGDGAVDNNDAIRVYAKDALGHFAYAEDQSGEYTTLAGSDDSCAFSAANQTTFGSFGACGGNSGNTISMSGFAGEIALIRVFDTVLSSAEITSLYDAISDVGDDDSDGMRNFWENVHGLDKDDPGDAALDADMDGMTNLEEHDNQTDPRDEDSDDDGLTDGFEFHTVLSDPLSPDSDGDGIDDADELAADPHVTSPILADTDEDGISDPVEIMVGSDPTLQSSVPQSILITEFMASNGFTLEDEDGDASDWIEILNPTPAAVAIGGMFLTDDAALPMRWQIPVGVTLSPGEFLIVFVSGKDRANAGQELHTNFNLSSDGEYLALIESDGSTLVSEFSPAFPPQESDISFGANGLYLTAPSPGGVNTGPAVSGFVADTAFSVDRGYYDAPFTVEITSTTPGATIIYTTDSSTPGPDNGTQVTGTASVLISETTVLRAAAFKDGLAPTNVDTHTYLFLDDIVTQSDNPNDYEYSSWDNLDGARIADYGMDTDDIVGNLHTVQEVKDALAALPVISMSTDAAKLFDQATGNYANSKKGGQAWEREVSLEFFGFAHGQDAQINGGLRLAGNASRNYDRGKHNMRVAFRREYGDGNLEFPLFSDSEVTTFNSIQLRGGNGDSWINGGVRDRATYVRDQWHRDVLKAMNQPTQSQIYAHLYINGWYWGVFHIFERIEDNFMAEHYGGQQEDWDVRDHVNAFDGSDASWNTAVAIADDPATLADPQKFAELQDYLDLEHTVDYLLLHYYSNSDDWDQNNLRSGRNRTQPDTYKFFAWDQERTLLNTLSTPNVNGAIALDKDTNTTTKKGPTHFHQRLRANPEYRLLFADRVQRHCFHGGPLTATGASAIWDNLAAQVRPAMIAESARWGDLRGATRTAADWENRIALEKSGWFNIRTPILLNLLRARNLFPDTDAPEFSINGTAQHGGGISSGDLLSLSAPQGTIVYTLDGGDPREAVTGNIAGTVYSAAVPITESATVKARALHNGEWSALAEAAFITGQPAASGNVVVSEIMYNPTGDPAAEYIELLNISETDTVDFTGCLFSNGIEFSFPDFTSLAPGGRLLIVRDLAAFEAAHGTGLPVIGVFKNETALSDSGEQITLLDAGGATVQDFAYNDKGAWPRGADGEGFSLVLIRPEENPDHNLPENWRSSFSSGGAPNATDATSFDDWAKANGVSGPLDDPDKNGIPTVFEYLSGDAFSTVPVLENGSLTLQFPRVPGRDDVLLSAEASDDLVTWDAAPLVRSERQAGSTVETLIFESSAAQRSFIRLRATLP